jgi:hypothetical protein
MNVSEVFIQARLLFRLGRNLAGRRPKSHLRPGMVRLPGTGSVTSWAALRRFNAGSGQTQAGRTTGR